MDLVELKIEELEEMIQKAIARKGELKVRMDQLEKEHPQEDNCWWGDETYYHFVMTLIARCNNRLMNGSCYVGNISNIPLKGYILEIEKGNDKIDENSTNNQNIGVLRNCLDECIGVYFNSENNSKCLTVRGKVEDDNLQFNPIIFKNYYELLKENVDKYPMIKDGHIKVKDLNNDSYIEKYNEFIRQYCDILKNYDKFADDLKKLEKLKIEK